MPITTDPPPRRWAADGTFLTQDPIGLAGGVNLYAYAGNNPIRFSDPFGLASCDKIKGTTAPCELFAALMGEARGATRDFKLGVANVIKNRANVIGGDYAAVVGQPGAFSAFNEGDVNRAVVDAVLTDGVVSDEVKEIGEGVFTDSLADNTNGSLLYYSPQSMMPKGSIPNWNFKVLKLQLDLSDEGQFYGCKEGGSSCWQKP